MKFNAYGNNSSVRKAFAPGTEGKHLFVLHIDQNAYGKWTFQIEHMVCEGFSGWKEFDSPEGAIVHMYHMAAKFEVDIDA